MKAGNPDVGSCKACGKKFSLPADPPSMQVIQDRCGPWIGPMAGLQYTCTRCGYVWRDYIEREGK